MTTPWPHLTTDERLDLLLLKVEALTDHMPNGRVAQLQKWIAIHAEEKNLLRQEIFALKAELTKEKKRSTFYHNTADQYRKQVEKLMGKKVTEKQLNYQQK